MNYVIADNRCNKEPTVSSYLDSNNATARITEGIFENQHLLFGEAKLKELNSWKTNAYLTEPYTIQKCISVQWVCPLKEKKRIST